MLRIGVIGYSPHIVETVVLPLIKGLEFNSNNWGYSSKNGRLIFGDKVEYLILNSPKQLLGIYIDQLIIADDHRWEIYEHRHTLISRAKELLSKSCAPEEFKVIKLELF